MRFTLERNCLVDLENGSPAAGPLRGLVALHQRGEIAVCVVAISASERTRNGTRRENFQEFQTFVATLGLGDAEILKPLGYWDVAFWDWCWSTKPRHVELERRIHEVLFPDAPFQYPAYERYAAYQGENSDAAARKWLNKKCDVLGLWSHINHGADVFVTSDENFHKATKKPKLEAPPIGAKCIVRPVEALALISAAA